MRLICCLFVGVYLLFSPSLQGQQVLSVAYEDLPFQQMVDSLEASHAVKFYYQSEWVDSLFISLTGQYNSIPDLLQAVLQGTRLRIFQASDNAYILSLDYDIVDSLPEDFWTSSQSLVRSSINADIFSLQQKDTNSVAIDDPETRVHLIGKPTIQSITSAAFGGYVRSARTGEVLTGVSVFVAEEQIGTLTDAFGYYVLNLPPGEHQVSYQYIGKQNTQRIIQLQTDGQLEVELDEEVLALDEIVISGEKSQVESVQTGAIRLNVSDLKSIPTLFGEADVLKVSLNLPGVQTVGEGASGFYIRGGTTDQNLILLDGAPLFNPTHLFGFFSAVNPSVVQYTDLSKSGIRAQYGGRASSVMDIAIRNGNKKKFIAKAGIGPITAKANVEGPMLNKTGSYLLGVRSTYANWLLDALDNVDLNNSRAFFADGIAKLSQQVNDKNFLALSAYYSRDQFRFNGDSLYRYENGTVSLAWRHAFSNQFSLRSTGGISQYQYELRADQRPESAFQLDYRIRQTYGNFDADWYPVAKHHLQFGWQNSLYQLSPGSLRTLGDSSLISPVLLPQEQGVESALYAGDEWTISPRFALYAGLRFSGFALLGPGQVNVYQDNLPREPDFITDTLFYGANRRMAQYGGPEFRLSGRYKLGEFLSTKLSYDRTRQYIHMLTNTIAVSPTDSWRLSNPHLPPQLANQWAAGIYREFREAGYELSVEGYLKQLQNLPEYKDGANLLVNETLESDVLSAIGRSYGIELLLRKKTGQFNGWIAYTYSRTFIKADSPFPSERINGGEWYPANYDVPHNLTIISNYKFTRRFNFSLNLSYRTGRPTTLPIAQYVLRNNVLAFYSDRNQFRIPDYFRLDFAMNLEGNHKVAKRGHSSWAFSVYNLTGRRNAYSVFSRAIDGNIDTYRLSIFGTAIPTLTYNFTLQ